MTNDLMRPIDYLPLQLPRCPKLWPEARTAFAADAYKLLRPAMQRATAQVLDPFAVLDEPEVWSATAGVTPAMPRRIHLNIQYAPPAIEDVEATLMTANAMVTTWLNQGQRPPALLLVFEDLNASARVFANPMAEMGAPVPWAALVQIAERYLGVAYHVIKHRSALTYDGQTGPFAEDVAAGLQATLTAACRQVSHESHAVAGLLEATRRGAHCAATLAQAFDESRLRSQLRAFCGQDKDGPSPQPSGDPTAVTRQLTKTVRMLQRQDGAWAELQDAMQARLLNVNGAAPTRITPCAVPHALRPGNWLVPQNGEDMHTVALTYGDFTARYQEVLDDLHETRHLLAGVIEGMRRVVDNVRHIKS